MTESLLALTIRVDVAWTVTVEILSQYRATRTQTVGVEDACQYLKR